MKRLFLCLLCLFLAGCAAGGSKQITVDTSTVIVCAEDAMEAALSLQTAIAQHWDVELEIKDRADKGTAIVVAVEETLGQGQYRTRVEKDRIYIEAQDPLTLAMGMRNIRRDWVLEQTDHSLTADMCPNLSGTVDGKTAPFLVLTQNIRYMDDEGGNKVIQRAPRFNLLVQEYLPDIICLQEDNRIWSSIVDSMFLENYGLAGTFSDGKEGTKGNRQAILFRSDRYELVEEGAVWLSDTPDEPYSKLADSKSCRHCTWAILKDTLTDRELFVCNTHLDNSAQEVREKQLSVLLERLGGYMEQYPTVLVGDFNAQPDEPVYATVTQTLSDPHLTAEKKLSTIDITCDKYGQWETPKRLDYMFYNKLLKADTYRVMTDRYDGYISDHFGVTTQYSFAP